MREAGHPAVAPLAEGETMRNRIWRWALEALQRVQAGQGLAEYGLLITLIGAATAAILLIFGDSVTSLYSQASSLFP